MSRIARIGIGLLALSIGFCQPGERVSSNPSSSHPAAETVNLTFTYGSEKEEWIKNVTEACEKTGVARLLHFSSIHALSSTPVGTVIDETRPLASGDHLLPYDRSKAGGERHIQAAIARGLYVVVVNPTAVLGPLDYKPSRVGEVLLDLYHGRLPALIDGTAPRVRQAGPPEPEQAKSASPRTLRRRPDQSTICLCGIPCTT